MIEGAGGKWQTSTGCVIGGLGAEPHTIFISSLLDCKKTPFANIKIHSMLGRIG